MNIKEAILDLIDNDSYLLWEVRGTASDFGDVNDIILESIDLVQSNEAICSAGPVIKTKPERVLGLEESISELRNLANWLQPASDYVDAIWLRLPAY